MVQVNGVLQTKKKKRKEKKTENEAVKAPPSVLIISVI